MINFHCIASRCAHTCCAGWEIDIDDETYELYRGIPGEFGDKIRAAIVTDDDGTHHFMLTNDERCPFLNERNLCDIILNLGEDYLCDICHEHPRFYKELDNGEYVCGYGLCCEEAARLTLFPGADEELDRRSGTEGVINKIKSIEVDIIVELCQLLATLESIEPYWIECVRGLLNELKSGVEDSINADIENDVKKLCKLKDDILDTYFTSFCALFEYMLFRFDSEEYATLMCGIISFITAMIKEQKGDFTPEDLIEVVRVYSADIEYSDENVGKIMEGLQGQFRTFR